MRKIRLYILASMLIISLGSASAFAVVGPSIGFDPTGAGTYTIYSDLWTNVTDSGLSVGFDSTPPFSVPYDTTFLYQARIGGTSLGGVINDMGSLNIPGTGGYELTFTMTAPETVTNEAITTDISGFQHLESAFSHGESTAGVVTLYFDALPDSTGIADPNVVSGYGGTDGAIEILTAHLFSLNGSFNGILTGPDAGKGTGSFNALFMIDTVNSNYLDLATDQIVGINSSGDTKLPPFYTPTVIWDGTSTSAAGNVLVKVDGSEFFVPGAVPEPSTIILLGTGFLGLGLFGVSLRKKA